MVGMNTPDTVAPSRPRPLSQSRKQDLDKVIYSASTTVVSRPYSRRSEPHYQSSYRDTHLEGLDNDVGSVGVELLLGTLLVVTFPCTSVSQLPVSCTPAEQN